MNPQTDTPESAEAMKLADLEAFHELRARDMFSQGHHASGNCAKRRAQLVRDTALKLQRCEEALGKANDIIDALAVALQHEAALERKGLTTVSWEALELASNFKALTHPTRNEGEKKV